ncbi:MAG: peptidoglycan glycosyltransferase [Lachnospiraceae bacterium]|nr:peptidoglycan glycosyltransferase [Lachnospiraceae bacterium]MBP3567861.1 peptidoglycan glycosyltransferase [Lachnospiraceae bacterium]
MREKQEKPKKKQVRKFRSWMQSSLVFIFGAIVVAFLILLVRLAFLSGDDKYEKSALAQQSYVSSEIPYKRGAILDRNGNVLAASDLIYHLILDPKVLLNKEENVEPTIQALVQVYGLDENELRTILVEKKESSYVPLIRQLSYAEKERMSQYEEEWEKRKEQEKDLKGEIKGVWFEEEYKRSYPYQTVASHIIGFIVDGEGSYGIEQQYNEELTGINGRTYGYYDSSLNIQKTVKEAENGNQIVSTIDINVQRVVQRYVEEFLDTVGAENVGVLMMDADNGEILAMQSNYSFDLNDPRALDEFYSQEELAAMSSADKMTARYGIWRNFCISDAYEPGSTFKPITVAAALEEMITDIDAEFVCDGKEVFGEDIAIKCSNSRGHGKISLVQSLMYSCNDALMQIAAAEGREIFYSYQKHFRMGSKTGIDLPGENAGSLVTLENLNQTELATSSFGQSLTVNMVQMASAFASLVNGGTYYEPHVVRAIKNSEGATIKKIEPVVVTKTVSADTSAFIKEAMYLTVKEGTATKAQVNGYMLGGKTGTAQKLPRSEGKNLVSFLGFVETEDRNVVIYVVVDEAHDPEKMSKSATASTLAAAILEETLPYLKMYPEGEINYRIQRVNADDILVNEEDNPDYNPENNEEDTNVIQE